MNFVHRSIPFLFLLFLLSSPIFSQECHKAAWVKTFGGNSAYNGIIDGDRLPDGRFVVLGTYGNSPLQLDTITLPAPGSYNIFLGIHDSSGTFHRATLIAYNSGGYTSMSSIDAGLDGRIHVTGYWNGVSTVLGDSLLPPASRDRMFVTSYDADLGLRWMRHTPWMSSDARPWDISGSPDGGVYVGGYYEANAFGINGEWVENYGGWNLWRDDAFLVKFDSTGQVEFLHSIGTPNDESIHTVTADELGDVIVSGATNQSTGIFKFDEQTGRPGHPNDYGFFIAKYDGSDGHCVWAHMGGGLYNYSQIIGEDACLGENNTLFLSGRIRGTVSVSPNSYYSYDQNAYLAKFDSQGNNLWLEVIGGQNSSEYGVSCTYGNGRVAVCGKLFSNQPYVGDFPLYSTQTGGSFDAFNALFDTQGELLWARGNNSSSSSNFYPACVLIDESGNQLYWGEFKATQDFYPVTVSHTGSNFKMFLARFLPFSANPASTVSAGPDKSTTCGTYVTLDGAVTPSSAPFGWWPDLGFLANNDKTPNVTPKQPQEYILYSSYQGCVRSDTVAVSISNYGNLSVTAGSDTGYCVGSPFSLQAVGSGGGLSYSWTPDAYLSTDTSPSPMASPPLDITYVVTASSGNCEARDTIQVSAWEKPYIYLPKQDSYYGNWRYHLCDSHHVDINMGSPDNLYTVLTPNLASNVNNNLATLLAYDPGGYLKVGAVSPEGCLNRDSVLLIVHNNQSPPVPIGQVPNRSACAGDSIILFELITYSLVYNFQYGWQAGWQVDSMTGSGWHDISIWDHDFQVDNFSSGYPGSSYYTRLRIPVITEAMNGFRFRYWVADYCSPRAYSNAGTFTTGPKITQHPQSKILCEGVTDSVSVSSFDPNASFQWQVRQGGTWLSVVNQPGIMVANGRHLRLVNVQGALDSLMVRCLVTGCSPASTSVSDSALIRVVTRPQILWQSMDDSVCEGDVDSLLVITNDGPYVYQWYANNNPITYNTSQICCYNTNKLVFTPVYLSQNNYTYKLKISNAQCNVDTFSIPVRFYVTPTAAASWPGGPVDLCEGEPPVALSGASPAGGSFSGPGVSGNTFDPGIAGVGTHTIIYGYAGPAGYCSDSVSRTFTVHPLPAVQFIADPDEYCVNFGGGGGVFLFGTITPAGGTFSGPGVSNNTFYPSQAGTGNHLITYSYTDPFNCSSSAEDTMFVLPAPAVSWDGDTSFCYGDAALYYLQAGSPAGGTFSGPGVLGTIFDPFQLGPGQHAVTYSYTDPTTQCTGADTDTILIHPEPVVSWPNAGATVCLNSGPFQLSGGMPAGGYYSGPGVTGGNTFTPSLAGSGIHSLWYLYTDPLTNCEGMDSAVFTVDPCVGLIEPARDGWNAYVDEGWLRLTFSSPTPAAVDFSLVNAVGQEVLKGVVGEGMNAYSANLRHLVPGMYVLHIYLDGGRGVVKFMLK